MERIYKKLGISPNEKQKAAIDTTEGPVILIAGPGSGKTFSLVLRTINLLVNKNVSSREILICTFTEKAALQLKTRISNVINTLGFNIDTSDITISTIHGLCNNLLTEFIEYSIIDKEYEILDELTQKLFIYDNFDRIVDKDFYDDVSHRYFGKWLGKWKTIDELSKYFNKFTEEMIYDYELKNDSDIFLNNLGQAYSEYKKLLEEKNYVDFSFLQYYVYELLQHPKASEKLKERFKYVMVDEYQDTNYIQERILFELVEKTNNICVVGDEDQALYRFRGATVRNLLEFPNKFPQCKKIVLDINYRSHKNIVSFYNDFMNYIKWGQYRFDKVIKPCDENKLLDYSSVLRINGQSKKDECDKIVKFIEYLYSNNIINDYSEVAILLSSVRGENSRQYIRTLNENGIPTYCPRAKVFFEYEEVKLFIGAMRRIFDYEYELDRTQYDSVNEWNRYLEEVDFYIEWQIKNRFTEFYNWIKEKQSYFRRMITNKENSDKNILDLFYEMLQFEPFKTYLEDDGVEKYNLAILTDLISKFNKFYLKKGSIITYKNFNYLKKMFFGSFLYVMNKNGMNEYEDSEHIVKKGAVQIMTIHQSKGLEFPVVIVGSIDKRASNNSLLDKKLQHLYKRQPFEKIEDMTNFDYMRKFYVAFSRPQNFLVLTTVNNKTNPRIRKYYNRLQDVNEVDKKEWHDVKVKEINDTMNKKQFSLTSHVLVYDICPKQYKFYKDVGFAPSRTGGAMFGSLVHKTIEDIHKHILKGDPRPLDNDMIEKYFYRNYRNLEEHLQHSLNDANIQEAKKQVINYYNNNKDIISRVKEAEVSITIEKPKYYLNGNIDVVLGEDNKYELWDFKSQQKTDFVGVMDKYKLQMATYVSLIKNKLGIDVERTYIYWTSEDNKDSAKMLIDVKQVDIENANKHFDSVVDKILSKNYTVVEKPPKKICRECDFRYCCTEKSC